MLCFSAFQATCKYERKLASLKSHQEHLQKRLLESEKRFQENDGWLHRIENEMKLLGHEGQSPEVRTGSKVDFHSAVKFYVVFFSNNSVIPSVWMIH